MTGWLGGDAKGGTQEGNERADITRAEYEMTASGVLDRAPQQRWCCRAAQEGCSSTNKERGGVSDQPVLCEDTSSPSVIIPTPFFLFF